MQKAHIYQIVAGFRKGDAVSDEATLLARYFSDHAYENAIYCAPETTSKDGCEHIRNLDDLPGVVHPQDIAILHLSIGSRANHVFQNLPCHRVILYHNVTPARFFERLNPPMAAILEEGRRQVAALAGAAEINLAVSQYNARELTALGFSNVQVFPLVSDTAFGSGEIDPLMRARLTDDGCVNLLFVGRVVPNKRHDKLLQVFHDFQHTVEPRSRLIIAGSSSGQEAYKSLLLGSVHTLELKRVLLTEFLSAAELNACYASASAFVCMSEHEGFCVPLLEAMAWNLPVFADAQAAIPETLAGSGVLFQQADTQTIAETIGHVLRQPALRQAVLAKQQQRLQAYRQRDVWAEMCQLLPL